MGYTFKIGEAVLEDADLLDEDEFYPLTVDITVKTLSLPTAPKFEGDELTGNSNERSPSYSAWEDFCRDEGLKTLFYDNGRLQGGHPGNVRLTPRYLKAVRAALARHKKKHRQAIPGWCICARCAPFHRDSTARHVERDGNLARLIWLEWWIDWALANCKIPTMTNT